MTISEGKRVENTNLALHQTDQRSSNQNECGTSHQSIPKQPKFFKHLSTTSAGVYEHSPLIGTSTLKPTLPPLEQVWLEQIKSDPSTTSCTTSMHSWFPSPNPSNCPSPLPESFGVLPVFPGIRRHVNYPETYAILRGFTYFAGDYVIFKHLHNGTSMAGIIIGISYNTLTRSKVFQVQEVLLMEGSCDETTSCLNATDFLITDNKFTVSSDNIIQLVYSNTIKRSIQLSRSLMKELQERSMHILPALKRSDTGLEALNIEHQESNTENRLLKRRNSYDSSDRDKKQKANFY
ncbi:hypothetical protein MP638_003840 [Amoeboaphelidium occidentale]|nr:hypothetical protein MP638_003840 [Amoeboaphelidium occidentale]